MSYVHYAGAGVSTEVLGSFRPTAPGVGNMRLDLKPLPYTADREALQHLAVMCIHLKSRSVSRSAYFAGMSSRDTSSARSALIRLQRRGLLRLEWRGRDYAIIAASEIDCYF